jgi:hypothetical protein
MSLSDTTDYSRGSDRGNAGSAYESQCWKQWAKHDEGPSIMPTREDIPALRLWEPHPIVDGLRRPTFNVDQEA